VKRRTNCWRAMPERLHAIETGLRQTRNFVIGDGNGDDWDIEIRGDPLGGARLRGWPYYSREGLEIVVALRILAFGAALDFAWAAFGVLAMAELALGLRMLHEAAAASAALLRSIQE
jgi:hypothetical protein